MAIVPEVVGAALDLGAGTGKFTELLQERARRTVAVEPSESMLRVLRTRYPQVEALIGSAEDIPLPDGSMDVVTVAQAFHWFDRGVAAAEIRRVLAPSGTLGLLWNHSDPSCAWDRACHRIAHPAADDADATTASADDELPGFVKVGREDLHWRERISREHYVRRWSTVSSFLVADAESRVRLLHRIEAVLDDDDETRGEAEFALPHVTEVYTYRRI